MCNIIYTDISIMEYYTNVIFKNRKIYFDVNDNENHRVLASEDIKAGGILFIEHLASNESSSKITSYVKFNKELFDNLYPRQETYEYEDRAQGSSTEKEVENLATEKVQKNVFGIIVDSGGEYYAIGVYVSKFNHNKFPNTCMCIENIDYIKDTRKQLCFVAILANKDIQSGSEITINYGKGYFDETEGCQIRKKINNIDITVKNILNKYMEKPVFHQVYNNLALADCECIYHYDNESKFIAK
jgi:hypothetical protein